MTDTIKDAIETNATGPAEIQGDEGRVRQHSLRDQIEADKYVSAQNVAKKGQLGIRTAKLIPPGGP